MLINTSKIGVIPSGLTLAPIIGMVQYTLLEICTDFSSFGMSRRVDNLSITNSRVEFILLTIYFQVVFKPLRAKEDLRKDCCAGSPPYFQENTYQKIHRHDELGLYHSWYHDGNPCDQSCTSPSTSWKG